MTRRGTHSSGSKKSFESSSYIRVNALIDLRASSTFYDNSSRVPTLDDLVQFLLTWKIVFLGFVFVIGILCFHLMLRLKRQSSKRNLMCYLFIVFSPFVVSVNALMKLYDQNSKGTRSRIIRAVIELFGAAGLISCWELFEDYDFNRALDQPVRTHRRLQLGAYQYIALRLVFHAMLILLERSVIFWGMLESSILAISEWISITCIAKYGISLEARQLNKMYFIYKSLKGIVWFEGILANYCGLSSRLLTILYAFIILQMVAAAFLQHPIYQRRGARRE